MQEDVYWMKYANTKQKTEIIQILYPWECLITQFFSLRMLAAINLIIG